MRIKFRQKFLAYCGKVNECGSGIVSIGRRTRLVSHNAVHYSHETQHSNETISFETFETVTKQLQKLSKLSFPSMVKKLPNKLLMKIFT